MMELFATIFVIVVFVVSVFMVALFGESKPRCTEKVVSNELKSLDTRYYKIFDNLILPSDKGSDYTEIDHVVVSSFGIWCVETKFHKGSIYGG